MRSQCESLSLLALVGDGDHGWSIGWCERLYRAVVELHRDGVGVHVLLFGHSRLLGCPFLPPSISRTQQGHIPYPVNP
eukprot:190362-Hanusia_phi.AAC.1